jgi:hypothetical protein
VATLCVTELVERRAVVVGKLKELSVSAEKVVAFLTNPALVKQLRNDKQYNLDMLKSEHQARARHPRPGALVSPSLRF